MKKIVIFIFLFVDLFARTEQEKLNALSEYFLNNNIQEEVSKLQQPVDVATLKKTEFETADDFSERLKRAKKENLAYETKINEIKAKYQPQAITQALGVVYGKPVISELKYIAKDEMFFAKLGFSKKEFNQTISIKVTKDIAPEFKKNIEAIKAEAIFDLSDKKIVFDHIEFPYENNRYVGNLTDLYFKSSQVALVLDNDYVSEFASSSDRLASVKGVYDDDLEKMLEASQQVAEDNTKWAFIVGIEKYEFTDNIVYSERSADMFEKVLIKRLGVKPSHIYTLKNEDATSSKIKTSMKRLLRNVNEGDTIYFYYNGHGVPVPQLENEPFMLASDVDLEFVQDDKYFSLQNIYKTLSTSKAEKVIAFVDSCFSGATDGKAILKGVAATRVKPKSVEFDKEKMAVITAGKDRQFSNGYNKKGYRLFSYFLMKDLIEGQENVKSLYKSTYANTKETSFEEYGDLRVQEPTIEGNFRLGL